MRKIALEEHFILEDFLKYTQESDFKSMDPLKVKDFQARLLDFDHLRIEAMDRAKIDISTFLDRSRTARGFRHKYSYHTV